MRGGALFRKFRDQIMGVIPARDPGPGKTKPRSGELDTHKVKAKPRSGELDTQKVKPSRGKTGKRSSLVEARQETGLVPLGKERYHRSSVLGVESKRTKGRSQKVQSSLSEFRMTPRMLPRSMLHLTSVNESRRQL
jgi:hypothetical protein